MLEKMTGSKGCFVCGNPLKDNPRSLGLDIFWDEKTGEIVIPIDPESSWCGYENTVHGGIIAAIADDAMAWSVRQNIGRWGVTARMKLAYRKPVRTGEKYVAKGSVEKTKSSRVTTKCNITDDSGKVIVEAEALFILQSSQPGGSNI